MPFETTDTTASTGVILFTTTSTAVISGTITMATWTAWTGGHTCTIGCCADATWTIWNGATASTTWIEWNQANTAARFVQEARIAMRQADAEERIHAINGAPYVPRKKTDAEVQAELLARRERERVAAEAAFKKQEAAARAEKLLFETLTPQQKEDIAKKGSFYLFTKSGRKYRIDRHTHGNVYLYDEKDRIVRKLCAQPSGVPTDDAILAQKLALEADEDSFLRVANATPM